MAALEFPSWNIPQFASGLSTFLGIGFVLACIAILIFFGYKKKLFFKYPTKFYIYRVQNGVLSSVGEDFGRRVVKKKAGTVKSIHYDIKKSNFEWQPPSYEGMIPGDKGLSVIHVLEIGHNDWKVIDPKSFITGTPDNYELAEKNELDDYFKNTHDDMAEIKLMRDKGKWQRVIDVLPVFLLLVGVGIAISLALGPLGDMYAQSMGYNYEILTQSMALLNASTQYVELLLRLNNMNASVYYVVNGTGVIP